MTPRHRVALLGALVAAGSAEAEVAVPTPRALDRFDLALSGEARALFGAAPDRFDVSNENRLIVGVAGHVELTGDHVFDNGLKARLILRGEREKDGFDRVRVGAPLLFGADRSPPADQRTLLERAAIAFSGGYGELSFGRIEGAADIAHVGAPLASRTLSLSNDERDLGGLVAIHTENDASSFGAKIRYATPRVLGARLSASYAPRLRVCGYGFCANDIVTELTDAVEVGLDIRRVFRGWRLQWGGSFTQAFRREAVSTALTRDYRAFGFGGSIGRRDAPFPFVGDVDFRLGGSVLRSNVGLAGRAPIAGASDPPMSEVEPYQAEEVGIAFRKADVTLSFNAARARAPAVLSVGRDRTLALQAAAEWRVGEHAAFGVGGQYAIVEFADRAVIDDPAAPPVIGVPTEAGILATLETRFEF